MTTAAARKPPAAPPSTTDARTTTRFEKRGRTWVCYPENWEVYLIARDVHPGTERLVTTLTLARHIEQQRRSQSIYTSYVNLLTGSQRINFAKEGARRLKGVGGNGMSEEAVVAAILTMLDDMTEHLLLSKATLTEAFACDISVPDDLTPPYALWPLVPESRPGMLVAPSGSGKSGFALMCGLSVVTGQAFLERLEPRVKGPVIYIGQEEDAKQWKARLVMLCRGYQLSDEECEHVYHNFIYMRIPEESSIIDSAEVLAERAATLKAVMIIIDSAQATWGGGDDQIREYASRWYSAVSMIGVPALVIEHPNASDQRKGGGTGGFAAGTSVKRDRVGHAWSMTSLEMPRPQDQGPYRYHVTLKDEKRNYVAKQPDIIYETVVSGFQWMKIEEAEALTAETIVGTSRLWGAIASIMRDPDEDRIDLGWTIDEITTRLKQRDPRRVGTELRTNQWRQHPDRPDIQEKPLKVFGTGTSKNNPGRYKLVSRHISDQMELDDVDADSGTDSGTVPLFHE